jgi:two-component system, NarL family, sensor histidine kinase DesK
VLKNLKLRALFDSEYIFLLYLSVYFVKYGFQEFIILEFVYDLIVVLVFSLLFIGSLKNETYKHQHLFLMLIIAISASIYNASAGVFFIFCSVTAESFKTTKSTAFWLVIVAVSILSLSISLSLPAYFWLVASVISIVVVSRKRFERSRDKRNELLAVQKVCYAIHSERERLSRDLHDSLGILLSKGILLAQVAVYQDKSLPLDSLERFEQLEEIMRKSLENIRQVISNSHTCDFVTQVLEVRKTLNLANIETTVDIDHKIRLTLLQKQQLLYIINELATNIIKHSSASKCTIQIQRIKESANLTVMDDGDSAVDWNKSNGLENVRSRIKTLNGTVDFELDSKFSVSMTFPLLYDN